MNDLKRVLAIQTCTGTSDGALGGTTRSNRKDAVARPSSVTQPLDEEEASYVDAAQELIVPEGLLSSVKELAFAFQRAASRLLEVRPKESICSLLMRHGYPAYRNLHTCL